jgi:hypothetical protein
MPHLTNRRNQHTTPVRAGAGTTKKLPYQELIRWARGVEGIAMRLALLALSAAGILKFHLPAGFVLAYQQ